MKRQRRIEQIRRHIEGRKLVWFGNRTTDGACLEDLPELSDIVGLVAPYPGVNSARTYCLESEWVRRVDLNTFNIDHNRGFEIANLHHHLFRLMSSPSVLLSYRPSEFLTALRYPCLVTCQVWAMPHLQQQAFEYKPWVESEVEKLGITIIPWRHYSTFDWSNIHRDFGERPLVLRGAKGSGGAKLALAEGKDAIHDFCETLDEGIVSASSFIENNLPLSVNAVVFRDGQVYCALPSVQLIGPPECTRRRFGFCGNDFGAVASLPESRLVELERATTVIGRWLGTMGYLGAFGVDFLYSDGDLFFTEVNPRFMASASLASSLSLGLGETDVYLEHMAAFAGLEPHPVTPVVERLGRITTFPSQIMVYNRSSGAIGRADVDIAPGLGVAIVEEARTRVSIMPEAQMFKLLFSQSVVDANGRLLLDVAEVVREVTHRFVAGTNQFGASL